MRPFVWGGLLLLVIVAFLTTTHVSFAPPMPPQAPVNPRMAAAEDNVVMVGPARGQRTVVSQGTTRKVKSTRGGDPAAVLHAWEVKGYGLTSSQEAYDDAIEQVRGELTHMLRLTVPPPREVIDKKLVKDKIFDKAPYLGKGQDVDRVTLQLELTRGTYLELAESERAVRISSRMEGSARILAIVVVALAALAGYIRLDEFTKGYYTGRLRLVTVVLVAAATVLLGRVNL